MEYEKDDIERLQGVLYEVLGRIDEVCRRLNIRYFIIAGSAIGAHFEGEMLAWDDDIDIGMEREDYERFLVEAQGYLGDSYTVQHYITELETPYYFAKVRRCGTRFEGEDEVGLNIHHGIYVDIFPMDRVPDNALLERWQRWLVAQLCNAFVATTIPLRDGSRWRRGVVKAFAKMLGKRRLYDYLTRAQCLYNDRDTRYINIVRMPKDHIERACVNPTERIKFGPLEVEAPYNLPQYLFSHYPNLRRYIPVEEQVNHAPISLNFNSEE